MAGWLFSEKKLIIVSGVPADTDSDNKLSAKQIEEFSDAFLARSGILPDTVLLVLISYKPDKRLKLYKFLKDNAEIKEFKKLSAIQLKLFVKEYLWSLQMTDDVIEYFLMKVGKDLYRISGELEKLQLWAQVQQHDSTIEEKIQIDQKIIDLVNYGQVEVNSFLFFDYLLPQKDQALRILDRIHQWGWDVYQTLGMMYWWLKLYVYLIDLYNQGITNNKTLAQMCKYHPFVVAKAMKHIQQLQSLSWDIKQMFRGLVLLDYDMKTGRIPDSAFWLELKKLVYNFWN